MKNVAASVRARLMNLSRVSDRPFQEVLHYYGLERFLYRFAQTSHSDAFVLKGALRILMQRELTHTDPYQTDDNTPTLTLVTGATSTALSYHLVRSMQLGESAQRIDIDFDEQTAAICGSWLGKLWRELRTYRVKEVSVTCLSRVCHRRRSRQSGRHEV